MRAFREEGLTKEIMNWADSRKIRQKVQHASRKLTDPVGVVDNYVDIDQL